MSSSITDFKAAILRNGGFARTNRFSIEILDVPGTITSDQRDLSALCESVTLPGKQITTIDYDNGTRSPTKIPVGFTQDDVTIIFNLTNNYIVKRILDSWMKAIINETTYLLALDENSYKRDIRINQLDESNRVIYTAQLEKAYPISVDAIELGAEENGIQKINAVFTYNVLKNTYNNK